MKILLILAFAVMASAAISVLPKKEVENNEILQYLLESEDDIELASDADDGNVEISPQNIILKWQLNRFLRKFQKRMPCGFPEYGVPPLAPARLSDSHMDLAKGALATSNDFHHLRVDGMDIFKFKKLKINLFRKRIQFDILFSNVKASAPKYMTKTVLDALATMGISIQLEADDTFNFGLKNLRLKGVLLYDTPILWGSNKIKSLKTTVSLEKCTSEVGGILGHGHLNEVVNTLIETIVEEKIAEMTDEISDMIEQFIVPKVNKQLKGTDFWDIVDFILNAVDGEKEDDPIIVTCIPPPDPWAND